VSGVGSDLHYLSMAQVAAKIRASEVSPVEVAAATIERIHLINPRLSTYYVIFDTQAMTDARVAEHQILNGDYRGPLHGIPIAIKDIVALGPTTAGSELRRQYIPDHDAAVVRRLRDAGAILVGKLATSEFALGGSTLEGPFPAPRNPWSPTLTPGGSSSGPGAAVAAGMAYGAVGSDTGGSIRMPASLCGVVGLKPSYGRVSRQGVFPLSWSLDHIGPMTRTVEDATAMLDACASRPLGDDGKSLGSSVSGMRIGIPWSYFEDGCDQEILASFKAAAGHMRSLGAVVSEVDIGVSQTEASAAFYLITLPEAAAYHLRDLRTNPELYGREFRLLLKVGTLLSGTTYIQAQRARREIAGRLDACFQVIDVLMLPTVGYVAEPIPERPRPVADRLKLPPSPLYTSLFNLTGGPAISIPCGFVTQQLPIGLQFAAAPLDDRTVLRAAQAYESTTEWSQRHPDI
jgi:aspartyl-tRNA(Asn)/glutamyl-tRNA(Gln) amidotransferase subunit A